MRTASCATPAAAIPGSTPAIGEPLDHDFYTPPRTMKAAQITAFGGYDRIALADLPVPAPGRGQVLARVRAAGVGPWDGWILAGKSALPQRLPLTLGADFAGEVVALGDGVSGVAVGDRIYGVVNDRFTGAWAEYAVADALTIARAPIGLSAVEAASAPIIAATARQALFDEAGLRAGQRVLILGAAGNVGAFAVQLARDAGLDVVATASESDFPYVRSLGASKMLGRDADLGGLDVNAVVDLVGGAAQAKAFAALTPGGKLVSAVSVPDAVLAATANVEARFFLVAPTTSALQALAREFEAGRLAPPRVGAVLPFVDARLALALVEGRAPRAPGKIVLRMSADS